MEEAPLETRTKGAMGAIRAMEAVVGMEAMAEMEGTTKAITAGMGKMEVVRRQIMTLRLHLHRYHRPKPRLHLHLFLFRRQQL